MWKLILTILACGACGSTTCQGTGSNAWPSEKDAEQTRVIAMYYAVGTDAYYNSIAEMKEQSDYVIEIRCWLGCRRYTTRIASYFDSAKEMSTCPRIEDKYLLIELRVGKKKKSIVYLKGGHIAVLNGKCFYGENGIDDFFPGPRMFEKMLDRQN